MHGFPPSVASLCDRGYVYGAGVKVGVDARALLGGRGIARYTGELLAALTHRFPDDEFRILAHGAERRHVPDAVTVVQDPRPQQLLFGCMAATGRPHLDRLLGGDLDVIWAPAPAPLAIGSAVPLVLTLHDLSFEQRPGDFTRYERLWHRAARPRRLVHRADRILADSEHTRGAAATRYGLDRDTVRVVLPGVGAPRPVPDRPPRLPSGLQDGRPYFLAVGALEPRKAPDVLAEAYGIARSRGLEADLVFVGTGRLAPALEGPGVHLLGRVDDTALDALYREARGLVMASWLEGFGFPPLEAAVRGTPAIVSDLPVFDETLGQAALRIPAGNAEALADALLRLAQDTACASDSPGRQPRQRPHSRGRGPRTPRTLP